MEKRPRIVILSASAGAGHVQAARALEHAFAARGDCDLQNVDAVRFSSRLLRKVYEDGYIGMVRRAPGLMGLLYDRTDRPWRWKRRHAAIDRLNTRPLMRLLKRMQPDVCISTHFLPAEIISWLKAHRKLQARHVVAVTDFDVHALWLVRGADRYALACEEAAEYLANVGLPRESLRVTGIPIDPVFAVPKDRLEMRRKHGLDPGRTTLLISAGGYGVGPIERLVSDLLALGRPWQIVAVAGKSEKTRARLAELARRAPKGKEAPRLLPVGFTTEMDEYMAVADLLIGKAGGLTVSEALARGVPLALVEPIPGQEERNADHLLEQGAAIRCNNLPTAAWKIARLLDDPARLQRMREAALVMARPRAAAEIAADAISLLRGN
jgi:processive 1,2-diacylglycerol beta-glucosyltransferase